MIAVLSVLGVVLVSFVLGVACGAIVDEVDSRRHLEGSEVLASATALIVFTVSIFVGLSVLG